MGRHRLDPAKAANEIVFAHEFALGGNASEAWRGAFGEDPGADDVVRKRANTLVHRPDIAEKIAEIRARTQEVIDAAAARHNMSKASLVEEYVQGVRASMASFLVKDPASGEMRVDITTASDTALASIQRIKLDAKGRVREIALYDRFDVGFKLARLMGWVVEKRDIRIIRSIEDLSDDELRMVEHSAAQLLLIDQSGRKPN